MSDPQDIEPLLSLDQPADTLQALQDMGVSAATESIVAIEKAGEGNMNLVMRVTTDRRTVIVKQARPWVEKYPSIAAPAERILAEIDFYERVAQAPHLAAMMPAVVGENAQQRLLVLEDLGAAADYSSLYGSAHEETRDQVFEQAAKWMAQLHQLEVRSGDTVGCDSLRELNHAHIFSIPFSNPPAIDLNAVCPGLEEASEPIRSNSKLREAVNKLGDTYLSPQHSGSVLLHGDFYPGSWLSTQAGFRVIDPEFCFRGPREFDVGVIAAHFIFCHAPAERRTIEDLVDVYGGEVSLPLVLAFAGTELIRRLIGVAQLPLTADLKLRERWLSTAAQFVLNAHE